jgi:adenylate cyclase
MRAAERRRCDRKETKSMDANDYYQQGLDIIGDAGQFTADRTNEARRLFEKAIKLEPQLWQAYAELAYVYVRMAQNGWCLKKAEDLANKALQINNKGFVAHWSLAMAYWNQGMFDESFDEYAEARNLNPNEPDLDADEAEARIYGGEPGKAIALIQKAMEKKPEPPYWYRWNLARAHYMAWDYKEAIKALGADLSKFPKDVLLITAASKAQDGDLAGAKADMNAFIAYDPNWSLAKSAAYPYRKGSDRDHWLDGLRKAGLKEN